MKKHLRLLLIFLLAFVLAACGRESVKEETGPRTETQEQTWEEETWEGEQVLEEQNSKEGQSSEKAESGEESESEAETESGEESESKKDGETSGEAPADGEESVKTALAEDGAYTSKEDVALYIHLYGRLPDNFITKKEAEKLGWEGGSLEPFAPGKCIGGSRFGNYEGLLPEKEGRTYRECDIDTLGAEKRGAKRIVFSNDGLVYYTEDHYESFELLYGEE